ncbi:YheC/YheD family protein [Alicyclobacillus pomorum]|uniref:YheC/YheD family endospore coat-associated protein n=1 Tax=Alicyclobacillus pomorum TaxID=204470 RepID=UPI0004127327|nr:YheC/YheD family protein [Alicyclobacillus pomorum]
MSGSWTGELVWVQRRSEMMLYVLAPQELSSVLETAGGDVKVSNLRVPLVGSVPEGQVIFRHRVGLTRDGGGEWVAGPIYAILAGSGKSSFVGARSNFRDIMKTARLRNSFVYVIPTDHVNRNELWQGYVRSGNRQWIPLPCPRPEAMYNRIPKRNLERCETTRTAKTIIHGFGIPLFNPGYFNKATIYRIIRAANLHEYLPETHESLSAESLYRMLRRHPAVYLKPTGGSIGHGMIRVEVCGADYVVKVLKNAHCQTYVADSPRSLWALVEQHRLVSQYVIQSAIPLIEWNQRPCDFRVLLQKRDQRWVVVGKGVRVAGANAITTHVPNGGSIAHAVQVLTQQFGADDTQVDQEIERMVVRCAEAIDEYYQYELGEMSMDVGVDEYGHPWFFEANSKPMKFDEPEIRRKSLQGILAHLDELRPASAVAQTATAKMRRKQRAVRRRPSL